MPDSIWQILEERATATPDVLAVVDGERRLTYCEVLDRTRALAAHLQAEGIGPGDRLAVIGANSLAFLELYFAAAGAGAVLVPVNIRLSDREVEGILEDSGAARLLRLPGDHEAAVAAGDGAGFSPAEVGEGDLAHLYYTSGTTGRPRGVMLTHRNVCLHARRAAAELSLTPHDVWGHIAPMFHLADAWATFAITLMGGRHVMVPRFDPAATLAAIEREQITVSNLIPTMLNAMVKHPGVAGYDLGSLRVVLSGGAPIASDLVRRVIETFGCDYVQTYGMTETSPYLTLSLLPEHLKSLTEDEQFAFKAKTGRPFSGIDLLVVDGGAAGAGGRGDGGGDPGAGRDGHAGLLERSGGDGAGLRRGVAFDRRPGRAGRGGVRQHRGPEEGHDHHRRGERLLDRGGERPVRAPGGAGGGGGGGGR